MIEKFVVSVDALGKETEHKEINSLEDLFNLLDEYEVSNWSMNKYYSETGTNTTAIIILKE